MLGRTLRSRIYSQLEPNAYRGKGLSPTNFVLCLVIVVSVLVAIVETEKELQALWPATFRNLELAFGLLFSAEYLTRAWVAVENPRFARPILGRLRYLLTPTALIDLLALMPLFLFALGNEGFLLRTARLLRVLRLARLGRFSRAMANMGAALRSRRYELFVSVAVAAGLLLISSTLLFLAEQDGQPDSFGSIPRAMWWSIATLTTVGYGDVYPITALGKLFAALTALTGIGLIAMPTGILAAAFSDAMHDNRLKALDQLEKWNRTD